MKICFAGFDLPEGKVKFQDEKVINLEHKFAPQKTTPFYAEFIKEDFVNGDAIFIAQDHILDLLILDMEKLENRRDRTTDQSEKKLLDKCLQYLEQETPLCRVDFNEEEAALLRGLAPLSLKPTVVAAKQPDINDIIKTVLEAAGIVAEVREVGRVPKNTVDVTHPDVARKVLKLMNRLDDHDDVQNVSSNFNIPEDVMAQVGSEA
jgi:hypothetical protein